jgi:hypothetical protein
MAAKTNSTNEIEFPLSVLLLHVSARFPRLFHCEMDGESYGEKRPGILAIWSADVCSVSHLGRFVRFAKRIVCLRLSSPQATVARWLRYWKDFTDAVKNWLVSWGYSDLRPFRLQHRVFPSERTAILSAVRTIDRNSSHTGPRIRNGPYGFRSTALLLSAARNYPGPVCVLGNLSCPHWQCRRGRSTHRKTIPRIGRKAV